MNHSSKKPFSKDILKIDSPHLLVDELGRKLKNDIYGTLRRKGAVIGLSGGIDSSVTCALTAKAIGPENILGLMMPEKDSSPESEILARKLADGLGLKTIVENISPALEGFKCYERRDTATKNIFPEFDPVRHKMKIGIKDSGLYSNLPPVFHITIIIENGQEITKRLPPDEFRTIMAASDFKQRSRMSMLYYHAERLHYTVVGTPNKHEERQGFFVKYGDGGADIMPIAHLYKTQVYQIAEYLKVPKEIIERTPTTDTYSAEQTQEEFFFQLPFEEMDLLWYAYENNYDTGDVSKVMDRSADEISKIFANFKRKQSTTDYLRMAPIKYI
ncbi:MAG: NAD(+) synthase [Bacteroidales bacterium]|nr:NAD(+) synthase [Bacteroidales bacterium]